MWRLAALLCLSVISVQADPNDLSGGVLILHCPPLQDWSCIYQHGDVCPAYEACDMNIQRCEDQYPRTDESSLAVLWYVIAAWTETKTWGGVEFGLGFDQVDVPLTAARHSVARRARDGAPQAPSALLRPDRVCYH